MDIGFWWESQKGRDHEEELDIGGCVMDLREIGWGGMDRINLVYDKDQWKALVNTVMNLGAPQDTGNFLGS
jgi:hypothetical protein